MIYKQNETPLLVASKVTSEVKEEVAEELILLLIPPGWFPESFIQIGQLVLKRPKNRKIKLLWPQVTSEITEVTEDNYLEVTKELFIYVVVPKNGSFHDL